MQIKVKAYIRPEKKKEKEKKICVNREGNMLRSKTKDRYTK